MSHWLHVDLINCDNDMVYWLHHRSSICPHLTTFPQQHAGLQHVKSIKKMLLHSAWSLWRLGGLTTRPRSIWEVMLHIYASFSSSQLPGGFPCCPESKSCVAWTWQTHVLKQILFPSFWLTLKSNWLSIESSVRSVHHTLTAITATNPPHLIHIYLLPAPWPALVVEGWVGLLAN